MADMTSDEALLMRAHREYWTPRVEAGVVVAMGPVADPAGGYGVAIIEAASDSRSRRCRLPIRPSRLAAAFLTKIISCQ